MNSALRTFTSDPTPTDQLPVVNLTCPICGRAGSFHGVPQARDIQWANIVELEGGKRGQQGHVRLGIRRCPNLACNAFVLIEQLGSTLIDTYPPQVIDFDSTNLPPALLSTLREAIQCHAAGAYRAAALMVRRLLEELCEEKGAKGTNLQKRLAALSASIVVPPELLAAADELRLLGNDAAHIEAKVYDEIGAEEVEVAIELAKELLKAVYQLAALVGRLKALKKAPPAV